MKQDATPRPISHTPFIQSRQVSPALGSKRGSIMSNYNQVSAPTFEK